MITFGVNQGGCQSQLHLNKTKKATILNFTELKFGVVVAETDP